MVRLNIEERQAGDVTILDLAGNITLGSGGRELDGLVRDLVREGRSKILLNLADVIYVDSSGLGHLISSYNAARIGGGQLKLLNLTKRVRDLLVITNLVTVFDTFNEELTALHSYQQ